MAAEPCPDPSVHKQQHHLSTQASSAALYVTRPGGASHNEGRARDENVLGPDGRLSSKSAATSLKHARPQDLPSFPSCSNTADAAGKAALLAQDYQMEPLWQPEQSVAGSKAAVLAAGQGAKLELWAAQATAAGQCAASLAFQSTPLGRQADGGNTRENRSKALHAATRSAQASRARAASTPAPAPALYPDAHNAVPNALHAAMASHRTSVKAKPDHSGGWHDEANQAARITNSHLDPRLLTERPDMQSDDDRRQAALKASAVSMAKTMYARQNRDAMLAHPDGSGAHHDGARAAARSRAVAHADVKHEALAFISLQDTAHRLAAERLAKIDHDMEPSRFREHYGYGTRPKRLSSRLSMRSVGAGGRRRRAASASAAHVSDSDDDDDGDDDQATARRIRSRTAHLGSAAKEMDEKRQQEDRARVLAAAEKRVANRMHDMDQQVYRDTGKVSESMMAEWEAKARVRAQHEREKHAANPGRTHIGGGKYMDTADIEAIAAARLKGTLDEIHATAEQRRARDAEIAAQKDEQERLKMERKMEDDAQHEEWRRIRDEDKAAARKQKEDEKARRAEEKRVAKDEKRRSRHEKRETASAAAGGATLGEVAIPVRHDGEPTAGSTTAADGREKHPSALNRLKDHFRKSGGPKELQSEHEVVKEHEGRPATAATVTTADPEVAPVARPVSPLAQKEKKVELAAQVETHDPSLGHSAGIAGTAGAAVGAGFLGAYETSEHREPASQVSSISGSVIADEGLYGSHQPPAEQQPACSLDHDQLPTTALSPTTKPDLERHISKIPESDDDDSDHDSDDWDEAERIDLPGTSQTPGVPNDVPTDAMSTTATKSVHHGPVNDTAAIFAEGDKDRHNKLQKKSPTGKEPHLGSVPKISGDKPGAPARPLVSPTQTTNAASKKHDVKDEKKGFKKLFSRIRSKSGSEKQPGSFMTTTTTTTITTTTSHDSAHLPSVSPQPGTRPTPASTHATPTTIPPVDPVCTSPLLAPDDASSSRPDEDDDVPRRRDTIASDHDHHPFHDARDHFDHTLTPSPPFVARPHTSDSPARETRFREDV